MFATWIEEDGRFAFTEESREGSVELTGEAYAALFAAQAEGKEICKGDDGMPVAKTHELSAAETKAYLIERARLALLTSDLTAMRCVKAGLAFPEDWKTYVENLRAIYNGTDSTSTDLPVKPDYPAGT